MSRIDDIYKPALYGKNIPILPLDNKWYKLMSGVEKSERMIKLEEELKALLKRQGKLNTEIKQMKKLKQKLMDEIVNAMDDQNGQKKAQDNKKLIEDCNTKMEMYQEELLDLPKQINDANYELMLETMDICYEVIQDNTTKIEEIAEWIGNIRIELKKNVVRKQERELKNQEMYSYMHDIFGPNVIDIFDMKFLPNQNVTDKKE